MSADGEPVADIGTGLLVLLGVRKGDTQTDADRLARKGNRPSFVDAAPPEEAEPLYERVRDALGAKGGSFGARMSVELVNEGPVTLVIDL